MYIEAKSVKEAKPRLERIETDILNNFKVLGVKAYPLNGVERLQIMYEMFHQEEERKFEFSYDRILQSGMTTKDFIAPTSFLFKSGKDFQMGDVVNQGMQEKQSITVRCMDIEDLEKQAEAIRVEQIKLYESYADGVLLRDAYIEKKKALSEKLAALQDSIRTEKEEQECADELDEEIRALTKQASEKTYIGGLTKECVDAFVSMVYLYDDQTMKIEFNCEDVIRRALEKYGA